MDPHAILGLEPGATAEQVQRAYRDLAKRFHPDRHGEAGGELMISINAAHDMLLDELAAGLPGDGSGRPGRDRRGAERPRAREGRERARRPGDWLEPSVVRVLARELLGSLEPGEQVTEVVLTSTGDSHEVQLALTDRRLLWLRDDAILGRVRSLRYTDVAQVTTRAPGRLRGRGELRLSLVSGRRIRFFDLRPEVLDRLARTLSERVKRGGRA